MCPMSTTHRDVSRIAALRLAAAAGCDPRTAERALREGAASIRVAYVRERLQLAMGEMDFAARAGARIGN